MGNKEKKSIWVFKNRAEMKKELKEMIKLTKTDPEWKRRYKLLGELE